VKRHDLISRIEAGGARLIRHGGKHDIYHNPKTGIPSQFLDTVKSMSFLLERLSAI